MGDWGWKEGLPLEPCHLPDPARTKKTLAVDPPPSSSGWVSVGVGRVGMGASTSLLSPTSLQATWQGGQGWGKSVCWLSPSLWLTARNGGMCPGAKKVWPADQLGSSAFSSIRHMGRHVAAPPPCYCEPVQTSLCPSSHTGGRTCILFLPNLFVAV